MNCNQCEALMINGVFCHETGCPNSRKRYCYGEWLTIVECRECGSELEQGTACDCMDEVQS
jgi:hypothetical protein